MQVDAEDIFNWKRVSETVQLAFQQHPHANSIVEQPQPKNHDFHHFKKMEHDDNGDSFITVSHHQGSKEFFQGNQNFSPQPKIEADMNGTFDRDMINNVHLTYEKSQIPPIKVRISQQQIFDFEQRSNGKDWKLVVEVFFGQRSHSSQVQKYKIFKGGISGGSAKKYSKSPVVQFKSLRLNYHTTVDKNSKIIIALYYLIDNKKKIFREVLLSRDLFIMEENKIMNIDTEDALKQYFDLFGSEFMDKLPNYVKINKGDKHALHDQINKLEQYLLKKNKRFLNIVFLSFKFPHFCQLYFKLPQVADESQLYDVILFKRTALSNCLTGTIKAIDQIKLPDSRPKMLCNYSNLNASLIFRINVNLRKVRIFVRKEFTDLLNVIVGEDYDIPDGYAKFDNAKELKEFYLDYYSYARKCKGTQNFNRHQNTSNPTPQHPISHHPPVHNSNPHPKKHRKADDDEYHEEQNEEDEDSEVDDSHEAVNYEKKNKKKNNILLQKLYANNAKKSVNPVTGQAPRQSKYPTRVKTRQQEYLDSPNHDKNSPFKKHQKKEKEISKKPQPPGLAGLGMPGMPGMTGMPGMMGQIGQGPMPFSMLSGAPQGASPGLFPLMQTNQKKDGAQGQKQNGPQMISMAGMPGMPGMSGMPFFGNMQGMGNAGAGGMMPFPMGMIGVPGNQTGSKKQTGKDGKEQSAGNKGISMMPFQGMGMPFFPQSSQPGQFMMMPNGQPFSMSMAMPQGSQPSNNQGGSSGQQQQQGVFVMPMGQQSGQQGSSNSGTATSQSNMQALQSMMSGMGGMPMGMIMQGGGGQPGGMQGIMMHPSMMGMMNPNQNSGQNSTSGSGVNMNTFSGSNNGMGFMAPNISGQKQQKPNQAGNQTSEAQKQSDSNKKLNGKQTSSISDPNQQASSSKAPKPNNLPAFLAPQGQSQGSLFPSPKEGGDKAAKNMAGGMQSPLGMPMMNGPMLTPQMMQQMSQNIGFPSGMQQPQQQSQSQFQPQPQTQSQQQPKCGTTGTNGFPQGQTAAFVPKLSPQTLNSMTAEQKQMFMQMQMQMSGMPAMGNIPNFPPTNQKKEDQKK